MLTEKAIAAYKTMLHKLNIAYIIVEKDSLDYEVLIQKRSDLFHIETLMLRSGTELILYSSRFL